MFVEIWIKSSMNSSYLFIYLMRYTNWDLSQHLYIVAILFG